jgi:hypothetical protein
MRRTAGVRALTVLLYLGAALEDADPAQKRALREQVFPAVDEETDRMVRSRIREVMGKQWRPSGEWADQLAALR